MEQKENIENNGFENFEDQNKYKSVTLEKQKKADLCAKISIVILLICIFILGIEDFIKVNPRYETNIGISIKSSDIVILVLYCISGIVAMVGFFIKKTNLSKAIFTFTVVFPISLVASAISCFLLLYILFNPLIQLAWSSM